MLPPEPPSPPTPLEPPDPPDPPPPQIRFSSSETPSQLLPFTFSFSFVSGKSESQSQTQPHFHSLFLVIPHNLKETEALLHLPFSMAAPDVRSPPSEPPNLLLSTRLASISCTLQVATQAVEFRAACLVLITSSSLPLPCSQVMHLLVSRFCLDCIHISIVGKSLAFVRSLTAVCRLSSDFISGIEHMNVLLPLWQFGLTSLMFIPPMNLVDFSFMEHVFLPKFPLDLSDVARSSLSKNSNPNPWKYVIVFDMVVEGRLNLSIHTNNVSSLPCIKVFVRQVLTSFVVKGFVPIVSIGIYGFVDVAWEVQSLFRAEPPHFGIRRQFLFPKFPLVWSGLDDQVSSVLQGSSSRLMVSSALVAELVALWVALDAVTREAVGIVFFRSLLVFLLELYFQSISSLTFFMWTSKLLLLCYLVLPSYLDVIPPLLIEFEA